jgi:hypothetical protein
VAANAMIGLHFFAMVFELKYIWELRLFRKQ